jgi:hypothetical protein
MSRLKQHFFTLGAMVWIIAGVQSPAYAKDRLAGFDQIVTNAMSDSRFQAFR